MSVTPPSNPNAAEKSQSREDSAGWFDTHAHLDQEEFAADRVETLQRARQAGVAGLLAVAVSADSAVACLQLAAQQADVWASVGIHPNYCAQASAGDWDRVVALVGQPKVVALGETGLDRHWDFSPWELQQDYFDRHLRLSQQTGLPFIVHCRDCSDDVLAMLREARQRGPLAGVMHSFSGDQAMAEECLALGLYLSFAGAVTFKKSDQLRSVAATVPAERLLLETDSPYLSPHPLRGKRNEPANLVHTARCLAEVRGVPLAELCRQTTANARRWLGLDTRCSEV